MFSIYIYQQYLQYALPFFCFSVGLIQGLRKIQMAEIYLAFLRSLRYVRTYADIGNLFSAFGPLTKHVILRVAHAPGYAGNLFPATDFKGNRELAIPACITARA